MSLTAEHGTPRRLRHLDRFVTDPDVRFGLKTATAILVVLVFFGVLYPTPTAVLFVGAVLGSLSALIAMGIVLVYRANRVINFAAGELGAIAAVLAVLLAGEGRSYLAMQAVGLFAALALGGAVEVLVVRRFARAPRLILTVATIGISQLLIAAELFLPQHLGGSGVFDLPSPIDVTFTWSPVVFKGAHVFAVLVVIAVGVALAAFLRSSRFGMAMRASAESSERAAQLGIPIKRVGTLVWVIAAGLSGIAALLRGPLVGVPIGVALGPVLLLRALAAAVIGRMESLPRTFAAAVVLGMVEQAVVWSTAKPVIADAVIFAVIIGALLVQGPLHRRGARGDEGDSSSWDVVGGVRPTPPEVRRLPEVRVIWGALIGLAAVALVVVPLVLPGSRVNLLGGGLILAIVAMSLVVLTGWAGQISLGQMAFVGFGAATAAKVSVSYGWGFFPSLLAAGVVGALVSMAIGIPALRIRGPLLAVATFGFAVASSSYFLSRESFPSLIVGERVLRPEIFGKFDLEHEHAYYYVLLAFFAAAVLALRSFRRSRAGRSLVATRDNPAAAQSYGISPLRARLTGFAVAGFFAATAGGLLAYHQHTVGVTQFRPEESLQVFALAVVGGLGSLLGAVVGATYYTAFSHFLSSTLGTIFVTGIGLLAVLLVFPGGLGQLVYRLRDALLSRLAARRGMHVPSLGGDEGGGVLDAAPESTLPKVVASAEGDADGALLRVRGLDAFYGRTQVLFGVSVDVQPGEVVALLGTNGAGKSTLLKAIVGSVKPAAGSVVIDGRDVTGMAPERVAALGIVLAPGGRKGVFSGLTVAENLALGSWLFRDDPDHVARATAQAFEHFPVLRDRMQQRAGLLSGGEQQMLMLTQALIAKPVLLMIDELSLGLAPAVVADLLEVVRAVAAQGTTVVLVEQSVNVALELAGRAVFMEKGEIRYDGPAGALVEDRDLVRSVFLEGALAGTGARSDGGRPMAVSAQRTEQPPEVALTVSDVAVSFGGVHAVRGASFDVHDGKILGLVGANGAGKTTILDVVSGFIAPDRGRIHLGDVDLTPLSPDARARLGLGRSFQGARLFPSTTVAETIAVALEHEVTSRSAVAALVWAPHQRRSESRTQARVDELIELFHLENFANKFISELSTGTRRVVELTCAMAQTPSVLLLDEPSAGIAQREVEALEPLLLEIRERTGAAMVVIEHDMTLVRAVADELVAVDQGVVIARGAPDDVLNDPAFVASYLGSSEATVQRSGRRVHSR